MAGDWAAALQGLGAGMQGQGAQWAAAQEMQKRTQIDQEKLRREAFIQEGLMAESMIRNGRPDQALALFESRVENGKKLPPMQSLGGNFDASTHVRDLLRSGDVQGALDQLSTGNQILRDAGLIAGSVNGSQKGQTFAMTNPETGAMELVGSTFDPNTGQWTAQRVPMGGGEIVGSSGVAPSQRPDQKYRETSAAQQAVSDAAAGIALNRGTGENLAAAGMGGAPSNAELAGASSAAKAQAAAGVENTQGQRSNSIAYEVYRTGMDGLKAGLEGTTTGPVSGRLPAVTANAQIAEGSIAAMAPILKQMFRAAGEGVFTDKDQALLIEMIPKRTDHPEARAAKISNIDAIVNAKLSGTTGQGTALPDASRGTAQSAANPNEGRVAVNPQTGQKIVMRNGQWVSL